MNDEIFKDGRFLIDYVHKVEIIEETGNSECPFCGISSFDHLHRAGSTPKEFERGLPWTERNPNPSNWKDAWFELPYSTPPTQDNYLICPECKRKEFICRHCSIDVIHGFLKQVEEATKIEAQTTLEVSEIIPPEGVSQWAERGKKLGYWEYFEKEGYNQALEDAKKVMEHRVTLLSEFGDKIVFKESVDELFDKLKK